MSGMSIGRISNRSILTALCPGSEGRTGHLAAEESPSKSSLSALPILCDVVQ